METELLEKIGKETKENNPASLILVTSVSGITPSQIGMMMSVFKNGTSMGTIGGGQLEFEAKNEALRCIQDEQSKKFTYQGIEMFIKVFNPKDKLIIVGGGHVGYEIYKVARTQDFHISIFDSRDEICNEERFPDANELYLGDVEKNLSEYNIDKNCYIVAAGHNHK